MIYDQEENNCFIFENEIDISSAKNWFDGYKTYQNYITNSGIEQEWHFNCTDIPSTISTSTVSTTTSTIGSTGNTGSTGDINTSDSNDETITEANVVPNENKKIPFIGMYKIAG